MPSISALSSVAASLAVLHGVHAAFDNTSSANVAVYWGQNSYGKGTGDLAQQRLSYYCASDDIDMIPLAFLTTITDTTGYPQLNFANQGDKCTLFNGTQLFNCSELAEDIPVCQEKYNKTITLSIGGATYTEGGFTSADEATAAADMIWATFGPPPAENTTSSCNTPRYNASNNTILRPFGSAQVDGFDFDFEATVTNMAPFAQRLRDLMDAAEAGDGRHRVLTAAPQCVFPDAADDQFLSGAEAVPMDAVLVQFYNNYCGVQAFVPDATTQNNFNFDVWDQWARNASANPGGVKVLVGVPASATAAGSGYLSAADLAPVLDYVKGFESFGGVMMWDVSQAYANDDFLSEVKSELVEAAEEEEEDCDGESGSGWLRSQAA
ncbi:Glycoside hydrolase family 18 protein [Lasiodiplodia theobromae]|uniref:Class III chitinprotein n=1 Tax=Lasiodiplodia theobromae TaxID=45133 RepID=A0A5N5DDQ3_9PEZI|nr:Glycoside hydrolase family 18 protein [Lasiodiplodia theobromae]KAB2575825.1 Class III chitinprotein [Lasiodiplodia theobromae]KAF4546506.1 Glycoside hydrolase family 18 protein [Lasiodiplodia theobromae]